MNDATMTTVTIISLLEKHLPNEVNLSDGGREFNYRYKMFNLH
ncbi:hypothetical protein ACFL2V_18720 [Pseudomonadota bacterium]